MKGRVALALAAALTVVGTADAAEPAVRASLEPPRARVGEVLAYTVTAMFPSAEDARDARIEAPPGPLEIVGSETIERDGARVTFTQRLACLSTACVPGDGERTVRLPAARVGLGGTPVLAEPAVVTMVPLVPAAAVRSSEAPWRRQTDTPAVETRVPLGAATVAFAAAAIALVVAAALLGASEWRRRQHRLADVDELRRALRLVRESAARDAPDRRRAAGLLSRVTRRAGQETTAGGADRVAWSQPEPAPADAHALADTAERASG